MNVQADLVPQPLEALAVLDDGVPGDALDRGAVVAGAQLQLDLANGRVGSVAGAGVDVFGGFWK